MKTQDEILRSPALMGRVVERVRGAGYTGESMPVLSGGFGTGMSIARIPGSQIVKVSYESYDPDFSALTANSVAEEFIKLHFERKVDTTRKATEFLQNQLTTLKEKVEEAEADLTRYAARHSILDSGGNQENVIRQRFGILNTQVTDAEKVMIARRVANEGMQQLSLDRFPGSLRTQEITSLETRVQQSEQDLSVLLTQFGENWPPVVRKKHELNLVKQQLLDAKTEALARAKRDAELNFVTARNEHDKLRETYRDQQQLVNQLNEASIEYNTLKRDVDASEQLYQGLLTRLKETGVSAALEFGNIHVTDPATPRLKPFQPQPVWNISLGLLLGLSAGVFLAFALEYMDRSLRSPADLEAMGIPLLGWIPAFETRRSRKPAIAGKPRRGATLQLKVSETGSAVSTAALATWDVRARESYRSLFASLLLSRAENPARCILITSAIPREGKTTTLTNLGATLAETGVRTLLIDSDFRNPSLSHRLGVANGKGLSVYLAGGEIDIRETQVPNLFILPAGPLPPNPVALFAAARWSETLARLKQEFRFILIDSPPVLSVADASILASKVDGVILVVKSGETPQEIIARANVQLVRSGASVLGAAVNHVDLKNPEHAYYRKYCYGYRYPGQAAEGSAQAGS
ncbi:MAG: polysaccharide biosynthesis tyrosine autokinase [Acidobacteria bacterium]|nr:polysaccharide biosynthesis tyrosine autokinase [Acidobacteriota bacterium]